MPTHIPPKKFCLFQSSSAIVTQGEALQKPLEHSAAVFVWVLEGDYFFEQIESTAVCLCRVRRFWKDQHGAAGLAALRAAWG